MLITWRAKTHYYRLIGYLRLISQVGGLLKLGLQKEHHPPSSQRQNRPDGMVYRLVHVQAGMSRCTGAVRQSAVKNMNLYSSHAAVKYISTSDKLIYRKNRSRTAKYSEFNEIFGFDCRGWSQAIGRIYWPTWCGCCNKSNYNKMYSPRFGHNHTPPVLQGTPKGWCCRIKTLFSNVKDC